MTKKDPLSDLFCAISVYRDALQALVSEGATDQFEAIMQLRILTRNPNPEIAQKARAAIDGFKKMSSRGSRLTVQPANDQ
jgi:hypothetical protein